MLGKHRDIVGVHVPGGGNSANFCNTLGYPRCMCGSSTVKSDK